MPRRSSAEKAGTRPNGGPHGLGYDGQATSFPTGTAFAASRNVEMVRRVGVALAEKARAIGHQMVLGPCINNIIRHPLVGRAFASFASPRSLCGPANRGE